MPKIGRTLAVLAGIITLGFGLVACGGADSAGSATCPNGEIKMGVEPYEDPQTLIPVYEKLGAALQKELNCPVQVQVSESYVAEILAMRNGELDIAQFGPLGFVFAQREANAVPVASFADENGQVSSYTGGIWVAKDSGITKIEDLAGKTLALSEQGSTSGDAVPRKALIDAKIQDKVQTTYAGGHTEALLALTNGKVAAAEINSQTLPTAIANGSFDQSKFTQIWKSEPIRNDPITVHGDHPREFQDAVRTALLNLKKDDVAALGEFLDFTSPEQPMVEVTAEDYKPVTELADALGLTKDDL